MRYIAWFLLIIFIAAGVWAIVTRDSAAPVANTPALEEEQGTIRQDIRAQVLGFGERLKNVSLLAPTAAADIEREYAPYVTRSLLASWTARPESALGRTTSSPWPERIDIVEIEESGDVYEVRGTLVFMTSAEEAQGGDAGSSDLSLIVRQEDGVWKVDAVAVLRQNAPNAVQEQPKLE